MVNEVTKYNVRYTQTTPKDGLTTSFVGQREYTKEEAHVYCDRMNAKWDSRYYKHEVIQRGEEL